jgi:hypothetical protein
MSAVFLSFPARSPAIAVARQPHDDADVMDLLRDAMPERDEADLTRILDQCRELWRALRAHYGMSPMLLLPPIENDKPRLAT